MADSVGGYDEIIRRLDELRAGQESLKAELEAGHAAIRVELADLRTEAMVAIRQSNESLLGAIEALSASHQKNRDDVSELKQRWG